MHVLQCVALLHTWSMTRGVIFFFVRVGMIHDPMTKRVSSLSLKQRDREAKSIKHKSKKRTNPSAGHEESS